MGRRQAVSHEILDLASGGSNPPAPAKDEYQVLSPNGLLKKATGVLSY